MAEIRGEKVKFSKSDYVRLHELPSAQVEDPLIVHCPPARSLKRFLFKTVISLALLIVASVAFVFGVVQGGAVDHFLTSQAAQALERSINPRFEASVASSSVRFTDHMRLALVASDVDISDRESGKHLSRVGDISMRLDPFDLLIGKLSVVSVDVADAEFDVGMLPAGSGFKLDGVNVASLSTHSQSLFTLLDGLSLTLGRSKMERLALDNASLFLPPTADGATRKLTFQSLELSEKPDASGYLLAGEVEVNGVAAAIALDAVKKAGQVSAANLRIDGFDLAPFLQRRGDDGELIDGLDAKAGLILNAKRQVDGQDPSLDLELALGNGEIYLGSEAQPLSNAHIRATYDFDRREIAIDRSLIVLGQNHLPLDALIRDGRDGPEFIANLRGARVQTSLGNEGPVPFDLRANGGFDIAAKTLSIPDLYVSGPMGDLAGSLKVVLSDQSPEISFGGQIPRMQASAVKQLWPYWLARRARSWTHANLFGGTVTNGSIAVFIPRGRMCASGCVVNLGEDELDIKFDIADTRINVTGEIPPLRDVTAKFHMVGGKLDVDVARATAFFQSDRKLDLTDSRFSVASFYEKPLLADVALNVTGKADAVAELASLKPITALQKTEFKPDDFTGDVKAKVDLKVGIAAKDNPKPIWNADLALSNMSLKPEISGRKIKDVTGHMLLQSDSLKLEGKGKVDDIISDITYQQPLGADSKVKKLISLGATLSGAQLNKLAPGLTSLISGSTKLKVEVDDQNRQDIQLDLSNATLTLPGIGWQKGAGIAANARFLVKAENDRLDIDDFTLKGNGFGAEGKLVLNKGRLLSANFTRMQLSPGDSYAVSISGGSNLMEVNARGASIDLRALLGRLRDGGQGQDGEVSKPSNLALDVKLRFDQAIGFHDEVMSNVDGMVSLRDGKLRRIDFKGVSGRGQAVVAQTTRNGNVSAINLASSDAGSLARFANLYSRINSGLLNLKLSTTNGESWSGSIDLRNFTVQDESKLQDIVATPTGADGRSLNKAVRRDINVSSEKFQRAFARLVYVNGAVALENGIIRGEQIGATFQGLVRDRNGNMDMTGTFMPAYGLNRIFGELPIIGAILGNGTDRGLLGITFKLTGKTAAPNLIINPLSLIAPGIFRQIFEFQ